MSESQIWGQDTDALFQQSSLEGLDRGNDLIDKEYPLGDATVSRCELLINGQSWGGWKRVEIQRGLEQIAGGFALEVTNRWPGANNKVELSEGLSCEVRLDGENVITGYIDLFETDMTETSSMIRVEGRDRTGDLVDCSAIHKTGQWRGARLEQIVKDLAAPFGILVIVVADTGAAFKTFALEDGETAFDAIDRACRLRGILPTSNSGGHLLLTRASEQVSPVRLVEGFNIKRIKASHSWKDRHSEIIVKSQVAGDDDSYGAAAAHIKARAKDDEINRYRPLVVMSEHGSTSKALAERATWESKVRMGRGKRGACTVVGWRVAGDGETGALWQPNTLVHIHSPRTNLSQEVLIVGCKYQLDDQGTTTELEFTLPEAFELQGSPIRQRKKKDGDGFVPSWQRSSNVVAQ